MRFMNIIGSIYAIFTCVCTWDGGLGEFKCRMNTHRKFGSVWYVSFGYGATAGEAFWEAAKRLIGSYALK